MLAGLANEVDPDFIFLNQTSLAAFASKIRKVIPAKCRIIVLSHGLESTDLLHLIRLRPTLPLSGRVRPLSSIALGLEILTEAKLRQDVDLVFALSPFDAAFERWTGAGHVEWLPRSIRSAPLVWSPTGNRLGFVGTLDHAPNLSGLVEVLEKLAMRMDRPERFRVRVVGGPNKIGLWLARRYPFIDYVGLLNDDELAVEAASWNALLHPIFCQPRGASTKLATAIGWQIPIVTTTFGCRGYEWRTGKLVIADDVAQFVTESVRLLDNEAAKAARVDVVEVAHSSPTICENSIRVRDILGISV
jgi:hypothetical protein